MITNHSPRIYIVYISRTACGLRVNAGATSIETEHSDTQHLYFTVLLLGTIDRRLIDDDLIRASLNFAWPWHYICSSTNQVPRAQLTVYCFIARLVTHHLCQCRLHMYALQTNSYFVSLERRG